MFAGMCLTHIQHCRCSQWSATDFVCEAAPHEHKEHGPGGPGTHDYFSKNSFESMRRPAAVIEQAKRLEVIQIGHVRVAVPGERPGVP